MDAHLAVWPSVYAVLTANLFQRSQANAQLLRNLLFSQVEQLLQLGKLDVAPRGHAGRPTLF